MRLSSLHVPVLLCASVTAHAQFRQTFTNSTPITIPVIGSAPTSSIVVTGFNSPVADVTVTLTGLTHPNTGDLDIVLLGPGGATVELMSDMGTGAANNLNLTFEDFNANRMPTTGTITSGTYRPEGQTPGGVVGFADTFPAEIPGAPTDTYLHAFYGQDPNTTWKLYISDDNQFLQSGTGTLASWSLTINARDKTSTVAGPITLLDGATPPTKASSYPMVFNEPFFVGTVTGLSLTLTNFSHGRPDDVDMLLVSPDDRVTYVLSDTGGTTTMTTPVTLTFDSTATATLPDSTLPVTGTYAATDYAPSDIHATPPAPYFVPPDWRVDLNRMVGTTGGTWELYAWDDTTGLSGAIGSVTLTLRGGANVPPVLDNTVTLTVPATNEDDVTNQGFAITALYAAPNGNFPVTDPDPIGPGGMGVVWTSAWHGQWQYSLDRGGTWQQVSAGFPLSCADTTCPARLLRFNEATRLRYVPQPNYNGTEVDSLRFRAWDTTQGANGALVTTTGAGNGYSALSTAVTAVDFTVNAVNDAPTISSITAQSTNEDTPTGAIAFRVEDVDTATLTVTATSSNTTLVPNGALALGGSGADRTVIATPASNQNGTTVITLTVSDGSATATTTFNLQVNAVNDAPAFATVPATLTVNEDTPATGSLTFGDPDGTTPVLTGSSSDPALLPNAGISFSAVTATSASFALVPAANAAGTATVTFTLSDGETSVSRTLTLTVTPVNDAPTLNASLSSAAIDEDGSFQVDLALGDVETPPDQLVLGVDSADLALFDPRNASTILVTGTGASRTVQLWPLPDAYGSTVITLSVMDTGQTPAAPRTATRTVSVLVRPVNDPPTIGLIAEQQIDEDTVLAPVAFTLSDVDSPAASLFADGALDNPQRGSLAVTGSGTNWTVAFTPAANVDGTVGITLTATDDAGAQATRSFNVVIRPVEDPPVLEPILPVTTAEDVPATVELTVTDPDTTAFTWVRSADNDTLITSAGLVVTGTQSPFTLTITPQADASGTAQVDLVVSDGTATSARRFTLTVTPVADAPRVTPPADQVLDVGEASAALPFTVADPDTDVATVTVTAVSDDNTLFPTASLVLGGSAGARTLQLMPTAGARGTAIITLTADDGALTGTGSFQVEVRSAASSSGPAASSVGTASSGAGASSAAAGSSAAVTASSASAPTSSAATSGPATASSAGTGGGGGGGDDDGGGSSGCGCSASPQVAGVWLIGFTAVLAGWRRRRR
ncbi:MAG: tandem-95 repeat protein [Deltaproteobacteria bacterium]|nr:tandem-95 repeat protein [Deltaproteobacteria bacterium]